MTETVVSVQVVLHENPRWEIERVARGIDGMARRLSSLDQRVGLKVLLGDASPSPILGEGEARGILGLEDLDSGRVAYRFFNANLGTAGGNNELARSAPSDYIFVLNPDTFPAPTALVELLQVMESDPTVGIAEARQIPLEHPKSYDPVSGDTSWASGACMLQRRSAFESVGGYDDVHFFLHCDDVDLSWRMRLAGYRVVHAPRAIVFHDKELDENGRPKPGATEEYYAVLGRLMLATRYWRPDVVEETLAIVDRAGSDQQRRAADEFRRRRSKGAVPSPAPHAESVAQFGADEYGERRY